MKALDATPVSEIGNPTRLVHSRELIAPSAAPGAIEHFRPAENSETDSEPSPAISRDSILQELHKVLESETFVHAKGLSRFLRFVVERSVEGRQNELKEYVIGVEVFDR